MKSINYEQMVEMLGIKIDQNSTYKHKYNCWQCRDTGVTPYHPDKGIWWNPPTTNDEVYWVLCNKCDYHRTVSKL